MQRANKCDSLKKSIGHSNSFLRFGLNYGVWVRSATKRVFSRLLKRITPAEERKREKMLRFACSSIYVVFDIVKSKHGDEKAIANVKLMIAARKMHKEKYTQTSPAYYKNATTLLWLTCNRVKKNLDLSEIWLGCQIQIILCTFDFVSRDLESY